MQTCDFKVQNLHFIITFFEENGIILIIAVIIMTQKNWDLELFEYIKVGEPEKKEKAKAWETAIGLQDVDGLKPSRYLIDTAKEHIEGNINIEEVENRINQYYKALDKRKKEETENTEEADKVAVRITEILSDKSFNFNHSSYDDTNSS